MSRPREIAALAVIILASIGVMIAFTLLPLLGQSGSGSPTSGERWWIVSATAVGALLLGGLVLRLREQSPRLATTLMALGAPAPALAWFWFPPLYALSAVLLVLVFVTHRRGPVMAV